ncbi:MAG: M55 family metallopeptidase [Gemmatimonadota bacterium]|nr:M55 family metallopeptidase [Gemmatimonadota bacterium]
MNWMRLAATTTFCLSATTLAAQRPVKVFISVDMEGIGGVVTAEQLGPTGFEYGRFREFMTAEALAAIAGAREAGATEFVVADSHGNEQNLLIERFPAGVAIVRGSPRPLGMMQGIDSTFAAAFFIGYHAATTNPQGVRAHTISSATLAAVKLNGRASAESALNAAIAGHYGVPIALISGDDQAVAELQAIQPEAEGAVVKKAISFHAASVMPPEESQALIRAKAKAAIQRLAQMRPYAVREPVTVDLTFKAYTPAEMLAYMPGVERVDAHTVRYVARTIGDVSRFISVAVGYRSDLTP